MCFHQKSIFQRLLKDTSSVKFGLTFSLQVVFSANAERVNFNEIHGSYCCAGASRLAGAGARDQARGH
jgi:hypothetical protein